MKTSISLKPATLLKAVLISSAALPTGNLTCSLDIVAILSATSRMHLPAVDLDTFRLSPISRCMDPVARNRRQRWTCKRSVRRLFLLVGCSTATINCKMWIMVGGRNLYRQKTSSASRSSSGFDRSLKKRGLLSIILLRWRSCRTCAAILDAESDAEQGQVLAQRWAQKRTLTFYNLGFRLGLRNVLSLSLRSHSIFSSPEPKAHKVSL